MVILGVTFVIEVALFAFFCLCDPDDNSGASSLFILGLVAVPVIGGLAALFGLMGLGLVAALTLGAVMLVWLVASGFS
ncbi:hypothetical protein GCM10010515_77380 [Streptomyces fructofermentans]|uniref:Uncharacterized protein n=1 Tax=Streptomyces fructofermentans TaxID=152141 RepID=A0A918NVL6_9ACTN|nr:hypothetical protein GCM10010515_77380 [Streptomyces fructofermentans]